MGTIPVFLINNHRVDSVADAEAYVARLREVERVMGEIGANIRHQAELGIVPPRFNFAPVREDGRRVLAGAPFADGPDSALFADFKAKVGRLQIPPGREGPADRRRPRGADRPVPPRLRIDARHARRDRAARRRATTAPGACPTAPHITPTACDQSTTTDLSADADPPDRPRPGRAHPRRDGADQGAGRLHRHAPAILRPHQRRRRSSNIRIPTRAGRPISPTPAPSSPR